MLCLSASLLTYPLSYDSAIYAAQKGDLKSADEQLRSIVVDCPDSADVLYDAGVLAHGLNNCNQAAAYFSRAAECAQDNKDLAFRAHFNAGNACVDAKDLKTALKHYDAALKIDPDNEYARHNRDRVAQMLQEQEQQKDQQKNKDQKDDKKDKDNQQEDQQNQDEQSGNQDNQEQGGDQKDQQQGNDQKKQNQNNDRNGDQKGDSSDKSDQQSQGEQGDDSEQGDESTQRKEQGNTEKNKGNRADNKNRNGDQEFDEQSQDKRDEREEQQGKQHSKTPEKQDQSQDKNNVTSADKQEQGNGQKGEGAVGSGDEEGPEQFGQKLDDPWLLNILNNQELKDKAINKQLMEAKVRQHGGKNGQNCW